MKKIILFASAICISGLVFMQSCTKGFEEMNRDPKNPTQASIPAVFNAIVGKLMLGGQEQAALHNGQYYFQSQQLGNAGSRYPFINAATDVWRDYYYSLKNVRMLETMLAESTLETGNAKAILDIVFAYHTLRVVNYYGDMPFSEAGRGGGGEAHFRVKYDNHKDIYYTCLDMLKSAADALVDASAEQLSYAAGDVLFGGDITKWKKFANSIRLRYAMQIVEVDAAKGSGIVGEVLGNPTKYPVINPAAASDTRDESIGMWLQDLGNMVLIDSRNWSFRENNYSCLGTLMWSLMSSDDNIDGSGIFDPRCYVFYEPNNAGEWKAYPQNSVGSLTQGGTPYKDNGTPPGARDYGQTLEAWNAKGVECHFSPVNFYLVRDVDYIPELFITAAEVQFLTAEAYNRGIGVTANATTAQAAYEAGVRASINFWYYIVNSDAGSTKWLFGPITEHKTPDVDAYLAKVPYSADPATALKQIYQQVWIDSFRQPWVAFDLYRRTLATPRDETGDYSAAAYNFHKLPYPEDERINNGANFEAATGGNNGTDQKLFWHK